jgi:AcrR family transcriptional regulator
VVLRTAAAMLEEQGAEALSLREIARRAKVSHNAPYRHFPGRESLLAALAAEGFEDLRRALQSAPASRIGERFVAFAVERPQRFRLMFGGRLALESYPELKERSAAAYAVVERAFAQNPGDASLAAAAAWSLVTGLAQLVLAGGFKAEQAAAGGLAPFVNAAVGSVRFALKAQRAL